MFDGSEPASDDVTGDIAVYDAGTEADTTPSTEPDQKLAQNPMVTHMESTEDEPLQLTSDHHSDFNIPADDAVINVTLTAQ